MLKDVIKLFGIFLLGSGFWFCEGPEGSRGIQGSDAPFIIVEPSTLKLDVGSSTTINVSTSDRSETYHWTSSNDNIASVKGGNILGEVPGLVFITVKGNSSKATTLISVTVSNPMATEVSFSQHVLPLFTTNDVWFKGSDKCTSCHYSNNESHGSKHAMDLGTHEGHMIGADPDPLTKEGNPLYGESRSGATDYNWEKSLLYDRLRNNRMPQSPGWSFRRDESNRNGPDLELQSGHWQVKTPHQYTSWDNEDKVANALGLLEAWVDSLKSAGNLLDSTLSFSYIGTNNLTFENDIKQFFTESNIWFPNSQACVECHFAKAEFSYHEMNLGSFKDIIHGADGGTHPILNGTTQPLSHASQIDWEESRLRHRLQDNRMPPNAPFLLDESNRDGPVLTHPVTGLPIRAIDLIGEWVAKGAQKN